MLFLSFSKQLNDHPFNVLYNNPGSLSFRRKYTISFAGPCEKDKLNLGANYDSSIAWNVRKGFQIIMRI
jgi:hypothetical protein